MPQLQYIYYTTVIAKPVLSRFQFWDCLSGSRNINKSLKAGALFIQKAIGDGNSVNEERQRHQNNSRGNGDKSRFHLSRYFVAKLFAFGKLSF